MQNGTILSGKAVGEFPAKNTKFAPLTPAGATRAIKRLLLSHRVLNGECWDWGCVTDYASVTIGKKRYAVHRLSYETFVGPIPDGMNICHKCDRPPCFNPDHLFPGSDWDNHVDMVKKGRSRKASQKFAHNAEVSNIIQLPDDLADRIASLTRRETQVLKLIATGFTNSQMAEHLQISDKTVEKFRANLYDVLGLNSGPLVAIAALHAGAIIIKYYPKERRAA